MGILTPSCAHMSHCGSRADIRFNLKDVQLWALEPHKGCMLSWKTPKNKKFLELFLKFLIFMVFGLLTQGALMAYHHFLHFCGKSSHLGRFLIGNLNSWDVFKWVMGLLKTFWCLLGPKIPLNSQKNGFLGRFLSIIEGKVSFIHILRYF